ncbi:uncharacterized protein [Hetaerina americana]|uniref:uncharacterized protein n=1 Tax=Hetaerina americana TaxID=62018 RepID=UPI003A7F4C2A
MFTLHKKLCVGSNSSHPDILSNLNNYDRPGRERCSIHHRYRPSSDRSRRSQSVGLIKSSDQTRCNNGRASLCPLEPGFPKDRKRARSIPPSTKKRVNSVSRSKQKSPSVISQHLPSSRDSGDSRVSARATPVRHSSSRKESSKRKSNGLKSSRKSSCSSGRKKTSEKGHPSRLGCPYTDSRQSESRVKASSEVPRVADRLVNLGSGHQLVSGSTCGVRRKGDHSDIMRRSMDSFKPYFFDSETVPSSMEVSKIRIRGGKRDCLSCEIGCSCRKCHYFTLSLVSRRQSCYSRRCRVDCSCSKCHFFCPKNRSPDRRKVKDHHKPNRKYHVHHGDVKKHVSGSYNQRCSRETQPFRSATRKDHKNGTSKSRMTESPGVRDPVRVVKKKSSRAKRRSRSKNGSKNGSRHSSVSRELLAKSRCVSKRKLDKSDELDASGTPRDSFSPKRRKEKKEVHYVCEPCGLNLNSWYLIRKHLLSSQHLQAVPKFRRTQMNMMKRRKLPSMQSPLTTVQSCSQQSWNVSNGMASSSKEHLNLFKVDRGDEDTLVRPSETFPVHKNNCGVPVSPLAVPESPGFIEGASNNAHMWASDEVEMSSGSKVKGCVYSSLSGDASKDDSSGCHEVVLRNYRQSNSPKKFIIRNRSKLHFPQTNSELQKSTFVRVDYEKKLSAKFQKNHMPETKCTVGNGMKFERACIDDSAYRCIRVDRDQLVEPYVNLGFRCDSVKKWASERLSAVKPGTVKRSQGRPPVRRRSSEDGKCKVGETSDKVNKMIRVDYHRKHYPGLNAMSPTEGSLLYVNEIDPSGRLSRGSSPIEILDSVEASAQLRERVYLSESEMGNDQTSNTQPTVTEDDDTVYMVDSDRFLRRLVKQLNSGGFSCQWCNNKIDGQSVMMQLYNWNGQSPNASTQTNHCAETDTNIEDMPE